MGGLGPLWGCLGQHLLKTGSWGMGAQHGASPPPHLTPTNITDVLSWPLGTERKDTQSQL